MKVKCEDCNGTGRVRGRAGMGVLVDHTKCLGRGWLEIDEVKTMKFEVGQRVRVKQTAFGDSTEPADVAARGATGELLAQIDDDVWEWRNDDGSVTFPIESEMELLEDEAAQLAG
jgi:hypothetical protein